MPATIGAARIEMSINSAEFTARMKRMSAEVGKFKTSLNNIQRHMRKGGRVMDRWGTTLSQNVTLPVLAAGGAATKLGVDFESSMAKIQNLVGLAAGQVDEMRGSVLSLARESGRGPQELSEALFTVTSAGARGSEALQILERAAKAAAVGLGNTKDIARSVTAVIQAYGEENIDAAKATDTLTAIVREGNLEAESLAPVLGRVVGIASHLGITFSELGASIATYTRLGVSAEEATTGIRALMNTLIKPSEQARKVLSGVGLSFAELRKQVTEEGLAATMTELIKRFEGNQEALGTLIPNVRALSAVLGTAGSQGQAYQRIQQNIARSTGIVDEGFREVSKTVQQKFNKALAGIKASAIEIGSVFLPVASKALDVVGSLADKFGSLSQESKNFSIALGLIAASAGPLLKVFGKLAVVLGTLSAPIWGTIGAGVALGVALGTVAESVIENWERFKERFVRLWALTKNAIVESLAKMFEALDKGFSKIPGLGSLFDGVAASIRGFKNEVPKVEDFKSFVTIGDIYRKVGEGIKVTLSDMVTGLLGIADASTAAAAATKTLAERMEELKRKRIEQFGPGIGRARITRLDAKPTSGLASLRAETSRLKEQSLAAIAGVESKWAGFSENLANNLVPLISQATGDAAGAFLELSTQALISGQSLASVLSSVLMNLADLAIKVGKIAIGVGLAIEGIKKALQSLNPVAALVAGAALIALGVAAKAALSKAAEESSSGSSVPRMASGGLIPPGFPNDTYPAMLTSGERVIPDPLPLDSGGGGVMSSGAMEKAMVNALSRVGWELRGDKLKLAIARGGRKYS